MNKKIHLTVLPKSETENKSVLIRSNFLFTSINPFSIMQGQGDTDYLCGACDATLANSVNRSQIISIVIKCGNCNAYNNVKGT